MMNTVEVNLKKVELKKNIVYGMIGVVNGLYGKAEN